MRRLIPLILLLLATPALSQQLSCEDLGAETVHVTIFVIDGQLTSATNSVNTSVFDRRGGYLDTFDVEMQRVGGGGQSWWGAGAWTMCRNRTFDGPQEAVSHEAFVADVIATAQHNTGAANVAYATYIHEDDFPGLSLRAGFFLALADSSATPAVGGVHRKPNALEQIFSLAGNGKPSAREAREREGESLARQFLEAEVMAAAALQALEAAAQESDSTE